MSTIAVTPPTMVQCTASHEVHWSCCTPAGFLMCYVYTMHSSGLLLSHYTVPWYSHDTPYVYLHRPKASLS